MLAKGKAAGVAAGGKKYAADRVVINLPVQEIFTHPAGGKFDPDYVKLCKNLVPTSGIFFDIALKSRMADYDGLLYTYSPMTYGMITSNLAEGLAPEGGQLLTMFYPTTMEDVRDTTLRMQRKDELWQAIKKYFPGIEDHILWKREPRLKMVDGAQVNTEQTERQAARARRCRASRTCSWWVIQSPRPGRAVTWATNRCRSRIT